MKPGRLQRGAGSTQTMNLPKHPTDFDDMLRSLEETWEIGDISRKLAPLKMLVEESQPRFEIRESQPLGPASSSMLCKRREKAKAPAMSGGWIRFGSLV